MDMDELVCRWLKADTTRDEDAVLAAWRRASPANEEHFRELVHLLEVTKAAAALPSTDSIPRASHLVGVAARRARAGGPSTSIATVRLRWLIAGGAVAAAGLAFLLLSHKSEGPALPRFSFGAGTFVTGPSETATVSFGDGSVVRLAPASRLRVIGTGEERDLFLDGRAFFAVAKLDGVAFRVRTRAGDAIVLGTRFEINAHDDDLRLVVVEGRVALSAGGSQVDVRGKQMVSVTDGTVSAPVAADDIRPMVGWIGKFIVFQSTPLKDVASELEREYGVKVNVLDSALGEQTVTGWYTDRTFDEILTIVCGVLRARCSVHQGTATVEPMP
jgi:transmembrane sensor